MTPVRFGKHIATRNLSSVPDAVRAAAPAAVDAATLGD